MSGLIVVPLIIVFICLVAITSLGKSLWIFSNVLPEDCNLRFRSVDGEFEEIVVLDRDGHVLSSNYTGVYGQKGAARKSIRDAKIRIHGANQPVEKREKLIRKFENRSRRV